MIKIIKKGTRDIRECESCGCLFSFDMEDIEPVFLDGRIYDHKCVKCPQCDYKVKLDVDLAENTCCTEYKEKQND